MSKASVDLKSGSLVLKVGTQRVPVVTDPEMTKLHWGEFLEYPYPAIKIAAGLDGFVRSTVILHELLHAFSTFYHLGLAERQVHLLEGALTTFCQDHPDVAKKFIEEVSQDSLSRAIETDNENQRRDEQGIEGTPSSIPSTGGGAREA